MAEFVATRASNFPDHAQTAAQTLCKTLIGVIFAYIEFVAIFSSFGQFITKFS